MSEKLKVGVMDITGCNGCVLSVAFNEAELLDIFNLIDIREYRFVSDPVGEKPEFDIVLMEGLLRVNSAWALRFPAPCRLALPVWSGTSSRAS